MEQLQVQEINTQEELYGKSSDKGISESYNKGNITANSYAGGIAGSTYSVYNSYNTGTIEASNPTGGIVGFASGPINSNYNVGIMDINSSIRGGIAGSIGYRIPISNNYYIEELAEVGVYSNNGSGSSNKGTTAVTSDELKGKVTDLGEEVWKNDIGINDGYPILSWQTDNDKLNLINGDNAFVEDTQGINNGYPILKWQVE